MHQPLLEEALGHNWNCKQLDHMKPTGLSFLLSQTSSNFLDGKGKQD